MKTTEELRKDLRQLARTSQEVAAMIDQIEDKRINWERAALHLYLSIAEPSKPAKKAEKTTAKA
ncbi:MAG: hypothetical protein EHM42_09730 [Planctomycetaceae bacterium]|nr:MAG: hypothetical protein EHM42_11070 [Planctomycetaceae bacterium]RPI82211.1 MAG: hypothetical protein EHM42_09730 [Planctomycetaceae bacterium]